MRILRLVMGLLLLCVAGCTGSVETRTGVSGPPLAAMIPVTIIAPEGSENPLGTAARAAVESELQKRGHAIAANAATRIEIGIAERAAPVELRAAGGTISSARKRKFLGLCVRKIHRLTLAIYQDGQPGLTRVWAEEAHCKSGVSESIAPLARRAVDALSDPGAAGVTVRRGRN